MVTCRLSVRNQATTWINFDIWSIRPSRIYSMAFFKIQTLSVKKIRCLQNVGHFYLHGWILIPAWISNYMPSKVYCLQLLIYSQTSTAAPSKFWNGYVISSHMLWWMWLLQLLPEQWALCLQRVHTKAISVLTLSLIHVSKGVLRRRIYSANNRVPS